MIGRHSEELNNSITECVQTLHEEPIHSVLEVEIGENGTSIIVMTPEYYQDLLSTIATTDSSLQEDVLLAIGGQISGWEDSTANLLEVADYHLHISLELVQQVVLSDEETYDGTDGVDKVSISPIGWERYLRIKALRDE